MQQAIINATIHTGAELLKEKVILIEGGIIAAITDHLPSNMSDVAVTDLQGKHISAGFIDIQVNGGENYYFTAAPHEAAIRDIYCSGLKQGTTHVLPCLITSSQENILAGIEAVRNYRSKYQDGVLGMHLEGPFISPAKSGAHVKTQIRRPSNQDLEEIIRYGKGVITLITVAPELLTDHQLDMLLDSGIVVSAGHSNMTYEQAQTCFSRGVKLVTHLFNAMTQFGHREPGLVGAALDNPSVYTPVILDGMHCHYASARIAANQKKEKFFLVGDATFIGKRKTAYSWQGFDIHLQDGFFRNAEGNLAGSTITMKDAVRNALVHLNAGLQDTIKMATVRAAEAVGLGHQVGRIAAGFPAQFVVFSEDLDYLEPFPAWHTDCSS